MPVEDSLCDGFSGSEVEFRKEECVCAENRFFVLVVSTKKFTVTISPIYATSM